VKTADDPHLELKITQLLDILDQWAKLCTEGPNEIIITKDGDDIRLEGKN
jgi:hypothetical protein